MIRRFGPSAVLLLASLALALAADTVAPLGTYSETDRKAWALQKRSSPGVPSYTPTASKAWVKNAVDAFVLDKLQKAGLKASPVADRATLARRLYFDLTGLPPAPAEVSALVADKSPDAYAKLVEKLLASPHYGERWGQHWLDVVRYAETDGYEYDTHRGDAWRYRDYVVRAFNNDKPFDRFIQEQVAGDEISPKEEETLIASGFNRLGPVRKNAGNQEVASSRNEILTEMTNVVGAAFLGVTVGCARCHDHKFDPIRQSDYYRLQAFFAGTFEQDVPRATPDEQAAWKQKAAPIEAEIRKIRGQMPGLRGKKDPESLDKREALLKQIEEWQDKMPPAIPSIHTVTNKHDAKTPIHVLGRGEYTAKGDKVGPRVLGVLLPPGAPELPDDTKNPRQELAKWLTDPEHPLTARVMVNRIWANHFGRGIVETPNDFGRMGSRPSNPELLDYLANQFVANGWSVKSIHRLILNSNTYQQSSGAPVAALRATIEDKDPDNKLLWRFNRRRLEAEEIRDAVLAVSGDLNMKTGGPSVMIPIDKGLVNMLYKPSQWAPAKDPSEHNRRGVYLLVKRNLALPFMQVFDAPDGSSSCPRRESSTHAPQALELLNGDLTNQHADSLAARLEKEAGPDPRKQIDLGYRLVAGRSPKPKEMQIAVDFLKTESKRQFAMILLNLNSFVYVN